MKILFVGEDVSIKESEFDKLIQSTLYPIINHIEEIAILNATRPEIHAIKWAKRSKIPYIGFLYNQESAIDYADLVIYIGSNSHDSSVIKLCDSQKKQKIVFDVAA